MKTGLLSCPVFFLLSKQQKKTSPVLDNDFPAPRAGMYKAILNVIAVEVK
jgi:hypothetical protein